MGTLEQMDRRTSLALRGAAVTAALLPLVYLAAVHVGPVHWLDAAILNGFTNLNGPRVRPLATDVATICDPDTFVWLVGGADRGRAAAPQTAHGRRRRGRPARRQRHDPAAEAGARERPRLAAARRRRPDPVGVVAERPRDRLDVAGAVRGAGRAGAAAAVDGRARRRLRGRGHLLVPDARLALPERRARRLPRRRDLDAAGGRRAVGGAGALAGAARAGRAAAPARGARADQASAAACAALLAAVVLAARPAQVVAYAQAHTAFVVGAGALEKVVALTLSAGLSLLTRRR